MTIPQARIVVAQRLGIGGGSYDGSAAQTYDLPVEQKNALTASLLLYISANPANFTAQQVSVANAEAGRAGTLALSTGYNDTTFLKALGDEVESLGESVASIGTGVKDTLNVFGKILPFVAVGAFVFGLYLYTKKVSA